MFCSPYCFDTQIFKSHCQNDLMYGFKCFKWSYLHLAVKCTSGVWCYCTLFHFGKKNYIWNTHLLFLERNLVILHLITVAILCLCILCRQNHAILSSKTSLVQVMSSAPSTAFCLLYLNGLLSTLS